MAVRRFSNSSRKVIKFPNIICVILVISHWRCLLITLSHDLAPSATLGILADWTDINSSTSISKLASRHLGSLSCCRRCINTCTQFRRKGFFRPVAYYSNSNAIFRPELLIICGDVDVNPGPVSKRKQARSTAPTCPVCEKAVAKNHKRFICWICHDMMHVKCSYYKADFRTIGISGNSPELIYAIFSRY